MKQLTTRASAITPIGSLLATILTLTFFTSSPAFALDRTKLDQFFDRLAEKNKAMGTLLITKDGQAVYARCIGHAQLDGDTRKPITPATRFRIGSITKTFTAAMILQLVEEKKLNPTDTLDKFLPQIPNAGKITIAQILLHRSGIPNVKREQNAAGNVNTLPMSKDEMLTRIASAQPDFEPDTQYRYSNSAYYLLGLVIEKVTAKPYAQNLEERIASRIGLADTYLATGNIDPTKNEALTYIHFGGDWQPVRETHPSVLFSAGAVVSTPADLAKFIHALFDGKIISKQSLDQMTTLRDGEGFGMATFSFAGKTFYGHTGGADNYGAWVAYLADEKLAVAYATNAKIYPVENIVRGAIELYYDRPFQIPALESIAVKPEILDQYVGEYSAPGAPAKAKITRDGGTLFFHPPGSATGAPLEATAQNRFQIEGAAVFEFDLAKNSMTVKRRGGAERTFTKDK